MSKLRPLCGTGFWIRMSAGSARLLLLMGFCGLMPVIAGPSQPNYVPFTRIVSDQKAVMQYRTGMQSIIQYMDNQPDLFPPEKLAAKRLPTLKQKQQIRSTWKSLLDYTLALDSIGQMYENFYLVSDAEYRKHALTTLFGAFVAQYRFALEYIHRIENDPGLDVMQKSIVNLFIPFNSFTKQGMYFLFCSFHILANS